MTFEFAFLVLFVIAIGISEWNGRSPPIHIRRAIEMERAKLEQLLRQRRRTFTSVETELDFDTAEIIRSDDFAGYDSETKKTHASINRLYKNKSGSYYLVLLVSSDPIVSITYLTPQRARNALRGDLVLYAREFPNDSVSTNRVLPTDKLHNEEERQQSDT